MNTLHVKLIKIYGKKIKRKYLTYLLAWTALPALVAGGVGAWLYDQRYLVAANVAFMIGGASFAVWLSAAMRRNFTLDEIAFPEEFFLPPLQTLIYVVLFGGLLASLCLSNVVGITIGDFSTQQITSKPLSAVLFGAACGFSENSLMHAVVPRLKRFLTVQDASTDTKR
jgi:Na+/phosphate symporter